MCDSSYQQKHKNTINQDVICESVIKKQRFDDTYTELPSTPRHKSNSTQSLIKARKIEPETPRVSKTKTGVYWKETR